MHRPARVSHRSDKYNSAQAILTRHVTSIHVNVNGYRCCTCYFFLDVCAREHPSPSNRTEALNILRLGVTAIRGKVMRCSKAPQLG